MVADARNCSICNTVVPAKEFCPVCTANFEFRRSADEMNGEEREIEMRRLKGPLEIPFKLVHKRIEELVGRPVWTHEMGLNWDGLVDEASHREHPSFQEVIGLIPKEKLLVVNPEDPEDVTILIDTLRQMKGPKKTNKRSGLTFLALQEQRRRIKPEILVQTLEKYASSGAAISAHVVNELIRRVRRRLSRSQLKRLAQAADFGARDQMKRGHQADSAKFREVFDLVQRKLAR